MSFRTFGVDRSLRRMRNLIRLVLEVANKISPRPSFVTFLFCIHLQINLTPFLSELF